DGAGVASVISRQTSPAKLATLDLADNRITDASALVPLGTGANPLGHLTNLSTGLLLNGNRIADFTGFSTWARPPERSQIQDQSIYAGAYGKLGGITLPALKDESGATATLAPGTSATYDAQANLLTLTGTKPIQSVTLDGPPVALEGNLPDADWI